MSTVLAIQAVMLTASALINLWVIHMDRECDKMERELREDDARRRASLGRRLDSRRHFGADKADGE